MKVFIWNRVDRCTGNWHQEGGIVVFADNIERARAIAAEYGKGYGIIREDEEPDDIREVTEGGEAVYYMPDAGCC